MGCGLVVLAAVLAVALAALTGVVRWPLSLFGDAGPNETETRVEVPDPQAIAADDAVPPRLAFDVVRVDVERNLVLAGRGTSGRLVEIRLDAATLGTAVVNDAGSWVLVPTMDLQPGAYQLRLLESGEGRRRVARQEVLLVVPERFRDISGADEQAGSQALALAVSRDLAQASRVMQAPGTMAPPEGDAVDLETVLIRAVDYTATGRFALSGTGQAGRSVRLYRDGRFVAQTGVDALGVWRFPFAEEAVPPGRATLRVDLVANDDAVLARAQRGIRLDPVSLAEDVPGPAVTPGPSLWRVVWRSADGMPVETQVLTANQGQIRDPVPVLPGQR